MAPSPGKKFIFLLIGAGGWASVALASTAFAADSAPLPIEKLGERLFSDKTLSEPQGVACASCHDPARGFSGVNGSTIAGVAAGAPPKSFGVRKPPGLSYAAFTPPFGFVDKEDETTGRME
jgi:cytochrome c peroxidase